MAGITLPTSRAPAYLFYRGADFQSAVSQNGILRAIDNSSALEHLDAPPITDRRYGVTRLTLQPKWRAAILAAALRDIQGGGDFRRFLPLGRAAAQMAAR